MGKLRDVVLDVNLRLLIPDKKGGDNIMARMMVVSANPITSSGLEPWVMSEMKPDSKKIRSTIAPKIQ